MSIEQVVNKLRNFYHKHRRLPSYTEMCDLFGFTSKNSIFRIVQKLIAGGVLEKDADGKLIPKKLFPFINILGSVAAGTPTPAEQQFLDTLSFDRFLINRPDKSYLLRVSGESMIDAGIHPGDLVVIENGTTPRNGDIVVAEVDGDYTLKYFRKEKDKIRLVPANNKFSPIYPQENLRIVGVVVSVIRKYH